MMRIVEGQWLLTEYRQLWALYCVEGWEKLFSWCLGIHWTHEDQAKRAAKRYLQLLNFNCLSDKQNILNRKFNHFSQVHYANPNEMWAHFLRMKLIVPPLVPVFAQMMWKPGGRWQSLSHWTVFITAVRHNLQFMSGVKRNRTYRACSKAPDEFYNGLLAILF